MLDAFFIDFHDSCSIGGTERDSSLSIAVKKVYGIEYSFSRPPLVRADMSSMSPSFFRLASVLSLKRS